MYSKDYYYDEILDDFKNMITDDFTKGYFLCMAENVWSDFMSRDEYLETVLSFIERTKCEIEE